MIFKEIREIIGVELQMSPMIALLNLVDNHQLKRAENGLIITMVTMARLIIAKNCQSNNQISREEWYREVWTIAIND